MFFVIYIMVSIILIIGGRSGQKNIDEFMERAVETVGTVYDIDTEIVEEKNPQTDEITYETIYYVHIRYKVNDGNIYSKTIKTSNNLYRKGDEITIFYDSEQPTAAKTQEDKNSGNIIMIGGVFFLIIGIVSIVKIVKKNRGNISNNVNEF